MKRKLNYLCLLLSALLSQKLSSQITPTLYAGFDGHNHIGHFGTTRNEIGALNIDFSLDRYSFVRPQFSTGIGVCKSNLSNNLLYLPLGAGISFGKQHFRIKPAVYFIPVFGRYRYQFYSASAEQSFTYAFSGELQFQWYGTKGFYAHIGAAFKYMPENALPFKLTINDHFKSAGITPSIGIGYTFVKGTFNRKPVSDTAAKNLVGVELFGSNFFDPNAGSTSIISVQYCRRISIARHVFQLGGGFSVFRSKYESIDGTLKTNPVYAVPVRLLWRYNYKRAGLWFGFYVTPAFGTQHYLIVSPAGFFHSLEKINVQGGPELSYQFATRDNRFVFAVSLSSKVLNGYWSNEFGDQRTVGLYGGVSISKAF